MCPEGIYLCSQGLSYPVAKVSFPGKHSLLHESVPQNERWGKRIFCPPYDPFFPLGLLKAWTVLE